MPVKMLPPAVIELKFGIQEGGPAHAHLTHICRMHMDKYVPYSGLDVQHTHMRELVTETVDSIEYKAPYAGYQYYGVRKDGTHEVHNYTTPGTGAYWDELMVSAEAEEIEKEMQEFVDKYGGK